MTIERKLADILIQKFNNGGNYTYYEIFNQLMKHVENKKTLLAIRRV